MPRRAAFPSPPIRPVKCDPRVGDATYLPQTLAATSPTTVALLQRLPRLGLVGRPGCLACLGFIENGAATWYFYIEGKFKLWGFAFYPSVRTCIHTCLGHHATVADPWITFDRP